MPSKACGVSSNVFPMPISMSIRPTPIIKVEITIDRTKREATVDFAGTSQKNNFNVLGNP